MNSARMLSAGPAIPVEIPGLNGVPDAGDEFVVVSDEKKARMWLNSERFD